MACVFPVKNKHHDEYEYHHLVKVKLKYFCFRSFDVLTGLTFERLSEKLDEPKQKNSIINLQVFTIYQM